MLLFGELDVVVLGDRRVVGEPLVVVVDRDGEDPLRLVLADHILVEIPRISCGVGQLVLSPAGRCRTHHPSSLMMSLQSSMHSSQMKTDGPAIELAHLVLALAAKGAIQQLVA
jgi:hypothetical protein